MLDLNGTVIQLSSGASIDYLKVYEAENISYCGIFYYKSFRFFVSGRSKISDRLLIKSSNMAEIFIVKIREDKNSGEDDHFFPTCWIYRFSEGHLKETWKNSLKKR